MRDIHALPGVARAQPWCFKIGPKGSLATDTKPKTRTLSRQVAGIATKTSGLDDYAKLPTVFCWRPQFTSLIVHKIGSIPAMLARRRNHCAECGFVEWSRVAPPSTANDSQVGCDTGQAPRTIQFIAIQGPRSQMLFDQQSRYTGESHAGECRDRSTTGFLAVFD
jgi:hypothetical protein